MSQIETIWKLHKKRRGTEREGWDSILKMFYANFNFRVFRRKCKHEPDVFCRCFNASKRWQKITDLVKRLIYEPVFKFFETKWCIWTDYLTIFPFSTFDCFYFDKCTKACMYILQSNRKVFIIFIFNCIIKWGDFSPYLQISRADILKTQSCVIDN